MQQKMIITFFVFEMVYGAPMSDFNPRFLFKDDLSGVDTEYTEIQTTAVPDLPDFLFKQFGHPPLSDNQILAMLIGSTAIPEALMTQAAEPTEETTAAAGSPDLQPDDLQVTEESVKLHKLEVELIEQAKEIEQRLHNDVEELKRLEDKIIEKNRMNSTEPLSGGNTNIAGTNSSTTLTSSLGLFIAIFIAML